MADCKQNTQENVIFKMANQIMHITEQQTIVDMVDQSVDVKARAVTNWDLL